MKKNTAFTLLFLATFGSVAIIEGAEANSQEIAQAETKSIQTLSDEWETMQKIQNSKTFEECIAYASTDSECEECDRLHRKSISLPEEIQIVEKGDILEVIEIDNDSIYLGFKH